MIEQIASVISLCEKVKEGLKSKYERDMAEAVAYEKIKKIMEGGKGNE